MKGGWGRAGENPPVVMQMSLYEQELVDHSLPQRLSRTNINIRRDRNRPAAQETRTPNNTPHECLKIYINKITAEQSQGQKEPQCETMHHVSALQEKLSSCTRNGSQKIYCWAAGSLNN